MFAEKAGFYHIDGTTPGQPFPAGTGGCREFRIPGLITLADGTLFAVCDARWERASSDFGGIDTVFAVSKDDGETWSAGFAALFPDSLGTPDNPTEATTCIDPTCLQAPDGNVHVFVNMNPSGITSGLIFPKKGTGFIKIGGETRLSVVADYEDADTPPSKLTADKIMYVGDYVGGLAPIMRLDGSRTNYEVDDYFNIYELAGGVPRELRQPQTGSDRTVCQNLFYKDSVLHVYNTTYCLHLTTGDLGESWSARLESGFKNEDEAALIISPGNGTVTSDGRMILNCYHYGADFSRSFIAWSDDGFRSFSRSPYVPASESFPWSGECKTVELREGLWRLFFRNSLKRICYADYHVAEGRWDEPVKTDVVVQSECNFSVIAGGGKLFASYPGGRGEQARGRVNGRLFTFAVGEDLGMTLVGNELIEDGCFSYSCLAEKDGRLFVLVDTCDDGIVWFRRVK